MLKKNQKDQPHVTFPPKDATVVNDEHGNSIKLVSKEWYNISDDEDKEKTWICFQPQHLRNKKKIQPESQILEQVLMMTMCKVVDC